MFDFEFKTCDSLPNLPTYLIRSFFPMSLSLYQDTDPSKVGSY